MKLIVYLVDNGSGHYSLFITDPPSVSFLLHIPLTKIPKKKVRPWKYMMWTINPNYKFVQATIRMLRESKSMEEAERIIRMMEHRNIIYLYSL
jgi:hypothetical protein